MIFLENILVFFDFDDISDKNKKDWLQKEIQYLNKHFRISFSDVNLKKVEDLLTGIDEYKEFIDEMIHFFLGMTRLEVILKFNINAKSFLNFTQNDFLFSEDFYTIYNGILFNNIVALCVIIANDKPETMQEIFISFCRVFAEKPEFFELEIVKTALKTTNNFLRCKYPEISWETQKEKQ